MTYITATCTPTKIRPSLLSGLTARLAVLRQRRALKTLDARALDDIGITRSAAMAEADRPFWDAPDSWRC